MTTTTEKPASRRDVEQEFRERAQREWFKDHQVAEYSIVETPGGTKIELLRWRKPGTSVYAIDFVVVGNKLFVSGDMYEATYAWSSAVSLRWIAGLEQHYFASKCMASPHGREFKTWDHRTAEQAIRDHFEDDEKWADVETKDCPDCDGVGLSAGVDCAKCEGWGSVEVPIPDPRRLKFEELDGWRAVGSSDEHEWIEFLREHGCEVFGNDHWEWTYSIGKVFDPACIAHLVGLKMAMAQVEARKSAEAATS